MKKSPNPEWRLSSFALATMIGTLGSILIVQRKLNLTFAIWYLAIVAIIVSGNAIYVFYKRKKKNRMKNESRG